MLKMHDGDSNALSTLAQLKRTSQIKGKRNKERSKQIRHFIKEQLTCGTT